MQKTPQGPCLSDTVLRTSMGKLRPIEEVAPHLIDAQSSVVIFYKIRYDKSTGFLYCFGGFLLIITLDQFLRTYVFNSYRNAKCLKILLAICTICFSYTLFKNFKNMPVKLSLNGTSWEFSKC